MRCAWCRDLLMDGENPETACGCRAGTLIASLRSDAIAASARCARLEGALLEIDRCFCPMAVSHPWVQAGLDSARKVLEGGT